MDRSFHTQQKEEQEEEIQAPCSQVTPPGVFVAQEKLVAQLYNLDFEKWICWSCSSMTLSNETQQQHATWWQPQEIKTTRTSWLGLVLKVLFASVHTSAGLNGTHACGGQQVRLGIWPCYDVTLTNTHRCLSLQPIRHVELLIIESYSKHTHMLMSPVSVCSCWIWFSDDEKWQTSLWWRELR